MCYLCRLWFMWNKYETHQAFQYKQPVFVKLFVVVMFIVHIFYSIDRQISIKMLHLSADRIHGIERYTTGTQSRFQSFLICQ